MIFKIIRGFFSNDLLVEIRESRLRVRRFDGEGEFDDEPLLAIKKVGEQKIIEAIGTQAKTSTSPDVEVTNPFRHSRSMVGNFQAAEKLLQHAFQSVHKTVLRVSPRVVMHQLEKTEGGLSDVEQKVLRELAASAGAREVVVYTGRQVSPEIESFDDVKNRAVSV